MFIICVIQFCPSLQLQELTCNTARGLIPEPAQGHKAQDTNLLEWVQRFLHGENLREFAVVQAGQGSREALLQLFAF